MRFCYLGGEDRRRYLQDAASPGITVECLTDFRPAAPRPETIESLFDEAILAPWTVEMAAEAERRGYDAVITGCAGDPGVEAARELVRIPVIGPGQAAIHAAAMLGTTFGVLVPVESTVRPIRALVRHYGLAEHCVSIRPVNCSVMTLRAGRPETLEAVLAIARRCVEEDQADVLALLCASLSHAFGDRLAEALPVPVVNVLRVSVRAAEMLVGSKLTHSKVAYPTPAGRGQSAPQPVTSRAGA
jgi:allantoin racemase